MNLKALFSEEMLSISAPWVDPKRQRALLEAIPELAPLVPHVAKAHANLSASQPGGGSPLEKEIRQNREQAALADGVHDCKVRGVWYVLTGLSELTAGTATADEHTALRDRVVPKGLATVQMSYLAEHGHAETVRQSLDADMRKALDKVRLGEKRSLGDEVRAWLAAADRLGALEQEYAKLLGDAKSAAAGKSPVDHRTARNQWIRAVTAVLSALDFSEIEGSARHALVATLELTEEKARKRVHKAAADADGGAPPADGTA